LDCRIDQRTDQFLVNWLGGILAHRTTAGDCDIEIHPVSLLWKQQ
jgi:hypothetical protein